MHDLLCASLRALQAGRSGTKGNAPGRVAFLAFDLYQRLTLRGLNSGGTIHFPLTQEDIADTLGITPIHVNRVLHTLTDRRLFRIKHHELTILDYEGLRRLADFDAV